MQTSQAQTSRLFWRRERSHQASGLAKLLAFFSSLFNIRTRVEDKVAVRYEGCAWCDSTEHRITRDITRL